MKQWMYRRHGAALERIAAHYGISDIMAEILVKRELYTWEDMDEYLYAGEESLKSPVLLKDMEKAASVLWKKIQEKKKICVIGDYDVDGIMSAYILVYYLRELGGDVIWRIPHRVHDGYGIRDYMVTEASEKGADTIVTCDNGISAMEAAKRAEELGMTLVITDHHEVPKNASGEEQVPPAAAVVDPKQMACDYPWKEICGGVVAMKVIQYLYTKCANRQWPKELLIYGAIATVCDVMPLKNENRIIVKKGLEQISNTSNKGLYALLQVLQLEEGVRCSDLGFRVGPCLNAAGRLEDASIGLGLLLETDTSQAQKTAEYLVSLNEERKEITARAVEETEKIIAAGEMKDQLVWVIHLEQCPESVAGIVAGRVREKYYRPTMILTGTSSVLKASGRSIPGYHMQQALTQCQQLLIEYGGHAMAAGFSLNRDNLTLFREVLNQNCTLTVDDLVEKISFDCEVPLGEVRMDLIKELGLLQPIGEGNPGPVFAKRRIHLRGVSIYGKENQIGRFRVEDEGRRYSIVDFRVQQHVQAVVEEKYGHSAWESLLGGRPQEDIMVDILYIPKINAKYGDIQYSVMDCR